MLVRPPAALQMLHKEGRPAQKNVLRLSFGIPSCESIRVGVQALGRAIRQVI